LQRFRGYGHGHFLINYAKSKSHGMGGGDMYSGLIIRCFFRFKKRGLWPELVEAILRGCQIPRRLYDRVSKVHQLVTSNHNKLLLSALTNLPLINQFANDTVR